MTELDEEIVSTLPALLADLARAAGLAPALRLAADFGGTEIYVPKEIAEDHPLAKSLGLAGARVLAKLVGGGEVDVPLGPAGTSARQGRRIRELLEKGTSGRRVARMVGCTERTVRRHKSRTKDGDRRQGRLF